VIEFDLFLSIRIPWFEIQFSMTMIYLNGDGD